MRGCLLGFPQKFIRPVPTLNRRLSSDPASFQDARERAATQRGTYSPSNSPAVKIGQFWQGRVRRTIPNGARLLVNIPSLGADSRVELVLSSRDLSSLALE